MAALIILRVGDTAAPAIAQWAVPNTIRFTASLRDDVTGEPIAEAFGVVFYVEFSDGRAPATIPAVPGGDVGDWSASIYVAEGAALRVQASSATPAVQSLMAQVVLRSASVPARNPSTTLVGPSGQIYTTADSGYYSAELVSDLPKVSSATSDARLTASLPGLDGQQRLVALSVGAVADRVVVDSTPAIQQISEQAATAKAEEVVPAIAEASALAAVAPEVSKAATSASQAQAAATQTAADRTATQASRNAAAQSEAASFSAANVSLDSRNAAEAAAQQAGNAAALATATANLFPTVATGLSATTEGNTFSVQAEGDIYATTYRKTGGEAVFVNQVASKFAVDKALAKFLPDPRTSVILQLVDQFGFALDFEAFLNGGFRTKTLRHNAPDSPTDYLITDQFGFIQGAFRESGFSTAGVEISNQTGRPSINALDGQGTTLEGARFVERPLPPSVNLAVVDKFGFGMFSVGEDGIAGNLLTPTGTGPEPTPPNLLPLYSGDVFLLPGQKLTLYPRNLFRLRSDAIYAEVTFDSAGYVASCRGDGELVIDADRCSSTGTLTIARKDVESDTRFTIALTIRKAAPAAQAPRVLMLGDSITNRQQALLTQQALVSRGLSPTYLGTVPGSASPTSTTNDAGPLGEAREGRAFADYIYSILDGEATPLPVGQEAVYLALTKADKLGYNPFIRPATGGDPSGIVRNGYVFDLRFYLNRFSMPDPRVLVVNLGENDIIESGTAAEAAARVTDGLSIILPQARAAVPTMRIGVALSGQPSTPDGEDRWAKKAVVLAAMIAAIRSLNDPLIYLVPTWAHVSPSAGWNRTTGTDDSQGVNTSTISDSIHPYGSARQQLADATAAFIAFAS